MQVDHVAVDLGARMVSRSLDVHITALRAKFACPKALRTIRGFGYRLG